MNKEQPLVIIKDKSEIYSTMGAIDTDEAIPTKCHSLRLRRSDHKRNHGAIWRGLVVKNQIKLSGD